MYEIGEPGDVFSKYNEGSRVDEHGRNCENPILIQIRI